MAGSKTISTSATKLEAFQLQSSAYGVTIPVVGGVARVAGNLMDYVGFRAIPHTSTQSAGGKGGGVKQKSTTYTYQVGAVMGICQGPIGAVSRIWKGKAVYSGGWAPANVAQANEAYTVPASGPMNYTLLQAATGIGAPVVLAPYVSRLIPLVVLARDVDYALNGGVITILLDKWRGKTLQVQYSYGVGSPDLTPLSQLGLSLANGTVPQSPPAWITASFPTHAVGDPGVAYVHAQAYDLGEQATIDNHSFEVQAFGAYKYGSTKPDCNVAEFICDVLSNGRYGARMPAETVDATDWITYVRAKGLLMSPVLDKQVRAAELVEEACRLTNSAAVWSIKQLRIVPYADQPVTGNGVTYTPNTTPIYSIDDDSWLQDGTGDPLRWSRKLPSDRFNHVRVQFNDRANYYNKSISESTDDADIAANGKRSMDIVDAPWICTSDVARMVAQGLMQRSLTVSGTGKVKLPWAFCLLEPMDLINVTDPVLKMSGKTVRITEVGEDEDGMLEVSLEDWPLGVASPVQYLGQNSGGYLHDYAANPAGGLDVSIFEAPVELAPTTGLELYLALSSSNSNWGGARVWFSLDGVTYQERAVVYGPTRLATLSASIGPGTSTVSIAGLTVGTQLTSGSAGDALANSTLFCVATTSADAEYMSYQTATLTGTGAYTLTGVLRGRYGSPAQSHGSGSRFARIDESVAKSGPITVDYIGKTVYFKVTSFNIYGLQEQDLSAVGAYSYTIAGYMVKLPPPDVSGFGTTAVTDGQFLYWNDPLVGDWAYTELRVGSTWATAVPIAKVKATNYVWKIQDPLLSSIVLARHVDTLGNYSAGTASVVANTPRRVDRVISRGNSDTASPLAAGVYNPQSGISRYGAGRSYNLLVLNRATGAETYTTYDVYGSTSEATRLANDLNALTSSQAFALLGYDEPQQNRLFGALPAAIYANGGSPSIFGSPNFKTQGAYVLAGIGGQGQGKGYEAYMGDVDFSTKAWCDLTMTLNLNGMLEITGAGGKVLTIGTQTLEYNAATQVAVARGSGPTAVTALAGIPNNYGRYDQLLNVNITPSAIDGSTTLSILMTAKVNISVNNPSGGLTESVSVLLGNAAVFSGFDEQQANAGGTPVGSSNIYGFVTTKQIDVTANTNYNLGFWINKALSSSTVNAYNYELRVEVIKR